MERKSSSGRISGTTRVFAVIGDPVSHSRSPAMQNAAFRALGLDCVYVAFRVTSSGIPAAIAGIRGLELQGVNVTVPHKTAVIRHLDSLTRRAHLVGAVNTIVYRNGRLVGDNTDVVGFIESLNTKGVPIRGSNALVIGAGGAARAVVAGLVLSGAGSVLIANRTTSRARKLARQFHGRRTVVGAGTLDQLNETDRMEQIDLIVNTTSIGWKDDPFPKLGYRATPKHCLFYDLVYGRGTDFLRRARRAGRPVMDGAEMLVQQGAAAFRLWTGQAPPIDAMRKALRLANPGTRQSRFLR